MMTLKGKIAVGTVFLVAAGMAMAQEPEFIKKTYPRQAISAAAQDMGALTGPDAALSAKSRELIMLGVSATVPCQYCIYYHGKAARQSGASDAEIREALAAAGQVRKWSTILNGSQYDMGAWRREVDAMFTK